MRLKFEVNDSILKHEDGYKELRLTFTDEYANSRIVREITKMDHVEECKYAIERMFDLLKRQVTSLPTIYRK